MREQLEKAFNEYSRPVQLAKPEDVKSDYYFSIQTPDMKDNCSSWHKFSTKKMFPLSRFSKQVPKDSVARVVIITHQLNQTQLHHIIEKIDAEADFTLLNTF